MSDAEASVSDLSREQLEERVARLEERVAALETEKADASAVVNYQQFNHFLSRLLGSEFDGYTSDPFRHFSLVEDLGDRFRDAVSKVQRHETVLEERHTPKGDGPEEHWWNVVEYAYNVRKQANHKLPDSWVILYKNDVAAATGVGERRAGQLIDEWGGAVEGHEGKNGTRFQPYQRASAAKNHQPTRKAIKIDLDVWEAPG